jgi:hypothetical protein
MSQSGSGAQRDELSRAFKALHESGIEFRGPFVTSKGELILIEDKALMLFEVLELFSKGQLNRDSIRNLRFSQPE